MSIPVDRAQSQHFSWDHVRYLSRAHLAGRAVSVASGHPAGSDLAWVSVRGISRHVDDEREVRSAGRLMQDALAGLAGVVSKLVFLIEGYGGQVRVRLGTSGGEHADLARMTVASLRSAFDGVRVEAGSPEHSAQHVSRLSHGCVLLGTPAGASAELGPGLRQIERLMIGLQDAPWAYLVIATPAGVTDLDGLFAGVLRERTAIDNLQRNTGFTSHLAQEYDRLLQIQQDKLSAAFATGGWHVGTYLLTDSAQRLRQAQALGRSIFGGPESLPDPIQALDVSSSCAQLVRWEPLRTVEHAAPGAHVRHPDPYLSLLSTAELAAFVHLPLREVPGFSVRTDARFDVDVLHPATERAFEVGHVLDRGRDLPLSYRTALDDLSRHALVVGTTGSGKTNTIFNLLRQAWSDGIPFLVIEPAKAEYRQLLHAEETSADLRVFTLGNHRVSPLSLNMFEVLPGVSVQTHIDLLKSVFNASFVMYAPMPQVLEQCIHEIYEDRGWDLAGNVNTRGDGAQAHPTLSDLHAKVDEVVARLGYHTEISMNVRAALRTRIDSLRIGGKGLMLDTRETLDFAWLLEKPTVLELEGIGDDDEKALVMAIFLMFLYEHHVARGAEEGGGLRHLTVIEEAHRLLEFVPKTAGTETANARGKAVEAFSHILAEVRAYGEGFVIADQIPSKLTTDVLKNTGLKIVHKTVAKDDRELVAGTMNLDEEQTARLTSLDVGELAVYGARDDHAVLVRAPYRKIAGRVADRRRDDDELRTLMHARVAPQRRSGGAVEDVSAVSRWKRAVEVAVGDTQFRTRIARHVLSTLLGRAASRADLDGVVAAIPQPPGADLDFVRYVLQIGIERDLERRGRWHDWPHRAVEDLTNALQRDVGRQLGGATPTERPDPSELRPELETLCGVEKYPFAECDLVCPDRTCRYRANLQPLLADEAMNASWSAATAVTGDEMWRAAATTCGQAAARALSDALPVQDRRAAAGCYAVHRVASLPFASENAPRRVVANLVQAIHDVVPAEGRDSQQRAIEET